MRRTGMNVKPVPTLDDRINEIRMETARIVNEDILRVEDKLSPGRLPPIALVEVVA